MDNRQSTIERAGSGSLTEVNKVLRQTYLLLSMTLIFSAFMAAVGLFTGTGMVNIFLFIIVVFGLQFGIMATRNSPIGILLTFALTGFMGWTLGPVLNLYIKNFTNGPELIMMALGITGVTFLVASAFGANAKRDLSHWGKTLVVLCLIAFAAILLNIFFFKMPALFMALSVIFGILMVGMIIYQTNAIVRGGERNYVLATVSLYISLYNLFLIILQLLGMFGGNRN